MAHQCHTTAHSKLRAEADHRFRNQTLTVWTTTPHQLVPNRSISSICIQWMMLKFLNSIWWLTSAIPQLILSWGWPWISQLDNKFEPNSHCLDHNTTSAGAKQFHIICIDPMNDVIEPLEHLMAHLCHAAMPIIVWSYGPNPGTLITNLSQTLTVWTTKPHQLVPNRSMSSICIQGMML
jgi:hypothetical protein